MKKITLISLLMIFAFSFAGAKKKSKNVLKSDLDSISYAFGVDVGSNIKSWSESSNFDLAWDYVINGMLDSKDDNGIMDHEAAVDYLRDFFTVRLPAQKLVEAEEFLVSVKSSTPGIRENHEGKILYVIYDPGNENHPVNPTDIIRVDYDAMTADGKVFDSSYERGEPAEFKLGRVIKGWTEAMKYIGEGGHIKVWLHPKMAYGEKGQGGKIQPNAALIFDVKLYEVTPGE